MLSLPDPHPFEAEYQGQRERSDRLKQRVLRTELEDAQAVPPSMKPKPKKTIGNESGARSTNPEVSPAIVSTKATRAKAVSKSGKGVS
jgi:hypothetical protein